METIDLIFSALEVQKTSIQDPSDSTRLIDKF